MSLNVPNSSGALSPKKLRGIYWKTFVGFVSKDDSYIPTGSTSLVDRSRLRRRQGSFEYMELTARGGVSLPSESAESGFSSENSSVESLREERPPMYAVLDLTGKKEFALDNDITVIEGSPDSKSSDARVMSGSPFISQFEDSPRCSPISSDNSQSHRILTPTGHLDITRLLVDDHAKDGKVNGDRDDASEDNSFDRLESTSPSMEPAPWKDQDVSIQLWMIPNFLSENDDKLMSMPPFPEFDHCHYVPTLESILEESEESSESRNLSRSRLTKSASFSDDAELSSFIANLDEKRSNSLGDILDVSAHTQSQEDLYSITSTFGSINSMRRVATYENLSTDEKDDSLPDSEGSSDELDRTACYERRVSDVTNSTELEYLLSESKDDAVTDEIIANVESTGAMRLTEVVDRAEASENGLPTREAPGKGQPETLPGSSAPSVVSTDFQSSGRSSPMVESAPELYEYNSDVRSPSPGAHRRDSGVTISDIDVPGLPEKLYFDSKDIPKIVVMFAREELDKDRDAEEDQFENEGDDYTVYRRRSDQCCVFESVEGGPVQKRVEQIKMADTSRLSSLSSSTPELSAMNEESLLYIPVSYASEAAALKKKKRNPTLTTVEALRRKTNLSKARHTRSLVSGGGLGNGFNSLRKRLRSRKSVTSPLQRSQSEKPQLSYSSPDVSSPMARFLNSPRRRARLKSDSQHEDRKGVSIKKKFTKVFRRFSSKFSSQRRPTVAKKDYKVVEQSPTRNSIDEQSDFTSESSSGRDNAGYLPLSGSDNQAAGANGSYRRNRAFSVPLRPKSQSPSLKNGSVESDVFDSIRSEDSLDNKQLYI